MKDDPLRGPRYKKFRKFHRINPHVFEKFAELAWEAYNRGVKKTGAHRIGEVIRWEVQLETVSDDGYKVCDHQWPYYSRLLMGLFPTELLGFFDRIDNNYDTTDEILLAECGTAPSPCEECGQPVYLDHICWEDCDG